MSKQILSIKVQRLLDENPDTSYLGEYSNHAMSEEAIDRKERGDMGRNEYRFFNPAMTGEETGNPESPEQDYERMESLNRGDWSMIGIRAEAQILVNGTVQKIGSAGLWGVESDSGKDYLEEVARQELTDLEASLMGLGFSQDEVDEAIPEEIEFEE